MLPYGLNTYHLKTRHFRGNRLACRVARPGPPGRDPIRPRSSLAHGKSNRPTCLLNPRPGDRAWVIIEPFVARVLRPAVSGEDRPGRLPDRTRAGLGTSVQVHLVAFARWNWRIVVA